METKCLFFICIQLVPVATSSFQQYISTDDIRFDKCCWPCNGAVNVTFSCQVHHRIRLMSGKNTLHCRFITDIRVFKIVAIIFADFGKGLQVTSVGKFIDINNGILSIFNNMTNYCRSNETRSTSN